MTTVRIKDLTTGTPAATDYLPIDRAAGTRKSDIQTVVDAGIGRYRATYTTTDATPSVILTVTPTTGYAYIILMYLVCVKSDGTSSYSRTASISARKVSGTVTIDGSFSGASGGSAALSTTDGGVAGSGGDVIFGVTGIAATTIKWSIAVDFVGVAV